MSTKDDLEMLALKGCLTGNELSAAASYIAIETAHMSIAERQAFLKGLKLAGSLIDFSTCSSEIVSAAAVLFVAASERATGKA
jgi:hypothetical protein